MTSQRQAIKDRIFAEFALPADITEPHQWWWNPRPTAGLRITELAFDILTQQNIACHEFAVDRDLLRRPVNLLRLDRFIQWPYHIALRGKPSLWLFSERDALMANLYGDVERFINSLADA